ncbi:hypothetical protein VMCG_03238 [Cytospora schulzeri]|uniref:Uncharacterized protein n=1 Tax=Cytospora schulzeri TaxID=448051 RepID=A0A423WYA3_9PEZI|nr:hypothetical protein VMCG_03238 [Valsa malicola]
MTKLRDDREDKKYGRLHALKMMDKEIELSHRRLKETEARTEEVRSNIEREDKQRANPLRLSRLTAKISVAGLVGFCDKFASYSLIMSRRNSLAGSTPFTPDQPPVQRHTSSADQNVTGMGRSIQPTNSPSSPTILPAPNVAFPDYSDVLDYIRSSVIFPEIVHLSMHLPTGFDNTEIDALLSLWERELSLRCDAATIQMAVLNDNVDRRQHEMDALNLALERIRRKYDHLQEMEKLQIELRKVELKLGEVQLEKLRHEMLQEGTVSNYNELDDLVNRLRSRADDKHCLVRLKDAMIEVVSRLLQIVVLTMLAYLLLYLLWT